MTASKTPTLTKRQIQALQGLSEGKTNRQIGEEAGLSEKTVKGHLTAAYRVLGVTNRVQASNSYRLLYNIYAVDIANNSLGEGRNDTANFPVAEQ